MNLHNNSIKNRGSHLDNYKNLYRYLIPFFIFSVFSGLEYVVQENITSIIYGVKIISTLVVFFILFRNYLDEIAGSFDLLSIAVGVLVLILWLLDGYFVESKNHIILIPLSLYKMILVVVIGFGTTIVIPLIEEVFFRSFIMRLLIKIDFLSIEIGTYTHFSFFLSSLLFAMMHDKSDWTIAFISGIIYGTYLVRSKNLKGVILAHSVTNLGLFINAVLANKSL